MTQGAVVYVTETRGLCIRGYDNLERVTFSKQQTLLTKKAKVTGVDDCACIGFAREIV